MKKLQETIEEEKRRISTATKPSTDNFFSTSSTEVEISTAKPTNFFMLGTPQAGKKLFASKKELANQDNHDKQYINLCDSVLDLRVVMCKNLTCRKKT